MFYLLEIAQKMDKQDIELRGLDGLISEGTYFPVHSSIVPSLEPFDSVSSWVSYIENATESSVQPYGVTEADFVLFLSGEELEIETRYSQKVKLQLLKQPQVYSVLSMSIGEMTTFGANLEYNQSLLYLEGFPDDMTLFSKDFASALCQTHPQWVSIPVSWSEEFGFQLPLSTFFRMGEPAYKLTFDHDGQPISVYGVEFYRLFDALSEQLEAKRLDAHEMVEPLKADFYSKLGVSPLSELGISGLSVEHIRLQDIPKSNLHGI